MELQFDLETARPLTPQERRQYKKLLDILTAHVTLCTGYEIVSMSGDLLGVEFCFSGGRFPLAFVPSKPVPQLVRLIDSGVKFNLLMASIPQLKPMG